MLKKKTLFFALASVVTLSSSFYINALATDDNISFNFRVPSYQSNGHEATGQYRQTTHTDNQWKVKLLKSGEGKGTITKFWLENKNDTNVSKTVNAKQGSGPYYKDAYKSASQINVWLTAENNNFNGDSYNVSGNWDEETW
ncbi:DUF2712 domain-containing protein [Vagococcus sp. PNs007]|uniref:DUF2712 domain-containing protein n=1 Tax=Vagococcus proximus TaxID=2991417 RepID=A0ABT5X0K9_9ENTE|nr:DUF2712 domain-containing protein [Vagococcus proximus]MDF0479540.1 DUF2712 domain-containing protein [Vagococcus proximus]